jgi:multicomponent Na+:H+ antiporter subunit E
MGVVILLAVPLALLFMTLSNQWSLDGFAAGYVVGAAVLSITGIYPAQTNVKRLPHQLFWLAIYVVQLGWNILLSSIDVARRVLDPRLPVNPGEVVVSTQDKSMLKAALSAHIITVTPGEMVIDMDDNEMVVHTLDVEITQHTINQAQASRLKMLRRILGEE